MAKQVLPTNFVDDILAPSMGGKRKFTITDNGDGTYEIEDVTDYTQTGSDFGAGQINATNQAVNESCDKADVIDDYDDVIANKSPGKIAGALALAYLSSKLSEEELIQDGLSVCTDVHAAVSGGSPKEIMFYRYGKTLNMRLNMHFSASIAQYATLFRLPSELRPKISQLFINNNGNVFSVNSESGAISPQQSIPSGTWLQISLSYLLP